MPKVQRMVYLPINDETAGVQALVKVTSTTWRSLFRTSRRR